MSITFEQGGNEVTIQNGEIIDMFKVQWLSQYGLPVEAVYDKKNKRWLKPILDCTNAIVVEPTKKIGEFELLLFLETVESMETLLCQ